MSAKQEFHIPIDVDGKTAVDWLAEASGLSRQKLKQYMQKGCVWLERVKCDINESDSTKDSEITIQSEYIQRLRRAKKVLNQHQILHFYYDKSILESETRAATLVEDMGDYSIWDKPSGMLSQGSKWGDHCTIYRWAEKHLLPERTAFVVHRLDRGAYGLMIVAHKKTVASQFSRMFEQRLIEKRYQVTVEGDFSTMLAKENSDVSSKQELTIHNEIDGKTAISHVAFKAFNKDENTSKLEIQIETGRKHQIRKHLSSLGFSVVGDRLYGLQGIKNDGMVDLQLQAKSLRFMCPVTAEEKVFMLDS